MAPSPEMNDTVVIFSTGEENENPQRQVDPHSRIDLVLTHVFSTGGQGRCMGSPKTVALLPMKVLLFSAFQTRAPDQDTDSETLTTEWSLRSSIQAKD